MPHRGNMPLTRIRIVKENIAHYGGKCLFYLDLHNGILIAIYTDELRKH